MASKSNTTIGIEVRNAPPRNGLDTVRACAAWDELLGRVMDAIATADRLYNEWNDLNEAMPDRENADTAAFNDAWAKERAADIESDKAQGIAERLIEQLFAMPAPSVTALVDKMCIATSYQAEWTKAETWGGIISDGRRLGLALDGELAQAPRPSPRRDYWR